MEATRKENPKSSVMQSKNVFDVNIQLWLLVAFYSEAS